MKELVFKGQDDQVLTNSILLTSLSTVSNGDKYIISKYNFK